MAKLNENTLNKIYKKNFGIFNDIMNHPAMKKLQKEVGSKLVCSRIKLVDRMFNKIKTEVNNTEDIEKLSQSSIRNCGKDICINIGYMMTAISSHDLYNPNFKYIPGEVSKDDITQFFYMLENYTNNFDRDMTQFIEDVTKAANNQVEDIDFDEDESERECVSDKSHELENKSTNTVGTFKDILIELKDAKVFKNSDEYKELIKAVEYINEHETVDESLSPEKNCAIKLYLVKNHVNKYLKHKADKGINSNSYNKLVAVERLNRYVSKALNELNLETFQFKNHNIICRGMAETAEEQVDQFDKNYPDAKCIRTLSYDAISKQFDKVSKNNINTSVDRMKCVDDCMCRIALTCKVNNLGDRRFDDIVDVRHQFLENPQSEKTAEKQPQNPEHKIHGGRIL